MEIPLSLYHYINKMTPEEFKTHVKEEKEKRLVNLKSSMVDKIESVNNKDISDAEAFFEKHWWISEYNMWVYLNSKWATPKEIWRLLWMNYVSEEWLNKIQWEFNSFCEKNEISTNSPIELWEAIECYLNEKMNYDAFLNFTALRKNLYSILDYNGGDELISIDSIKYGYKSYPDIANLTSALKEDNATKVLSHAIRMSLDDPLHNNDFGFSNDQINAFIETWNAIVKAIDTINLEEYHITKEEFLTWCNEIFQAFNSKDTIKIKETIKSNAMIFSICVGWQINQDIINKSQKSTGLSTVFSTWDYKDLNTLLDVSKWGIWVCRHLSLAFKHIYNYISKEKGLDAEAINVIDPKNDHTKNIVLYLNNKCKVEQKYFDPTWRIWSNSKININWTYKKVIKEEIKGADTEKKGADTEKKDLQYNGELRVNTEDNNTNASV